MAQEIVAVLGLGTMGRGIAEVCAAAGHKVFLWDLHKKIVDSFIEEKKSLSFHLMENFDLLNEASVIIEAIIESEDVKGQLLQNIGPYALHPKLLMATNTSALSITKLASLFSRPTHFLGLHFFNPVPVMSLVEIVKGVQTSVDTLQRGCSFVESLGKIGIEVDNRPGFVVNRILVPMINEACFILYEGVAKPAQIDQAMKLGCRHPIGPLALADLIGIDVCLSILKILYQQFRDPKYRPCVLWQDLVDSGRLGRKAGYGFYEYTSP